MKHVKKLIAFHAHEMPCPHSEQDVSASDLAVASIVLHLVLAIALVQIQSHGLPPMS